jgi:CRP/FNR family cyclic AMP-dependent transcriptional regulator
MEDLDFTRPARHEIYDPAIARACFESLGKSESFAQGQSFFAEGETSDRMYLLLEGEASLIRGKKLIDIVKAGEIFGELAAITQQPRTAAAMARGACRVISLDAKQFQRAIQKTPEFALMLMSIMINRLRLADAMARMTHSLPNWTGKHDSRVFDRKLVDELAGAVSPQRCPKDKVIMTEGEGGVFFYVVLQGRIAISIQSTVVERVGPGGVFGEMALVDQSPRAASAVAETDCSLLAINRKDFLALVKTKPAFAVSLLEGLAERLRHMTLDQR